MSLNFTSFYGRWLGLTYGSSAGSKGGQNKYLSGDSQGTKFANFWFGTQGAEVAQHGLDALQTLTSGTTATTITPAGAVTITTSSTSVQVWSMAAPFPTGVKYVQNASTVAVTITLAGGNFQTTAGSSWIKALFQAAAAGGNMTVVGVSTSIYQVMGTLPTTTVLQFST
jgi:hypothetical protein